MSYIRRIFQVVLFFILILGGQSLLAQVPDSCDLTGFTTYTQGGWGSSSTSVPGQIRDQYFDLVFPNDLVLGGTYTLTLTTANAVMNFIPQGGTAYKFIQNYVDPTSTSAGVFGGQLVAATMNVYFDLEGYIGTNTEFTLGELVITSGPFEGKTVLELLAIANEAIGGGAVPYTYVEISNALTHLNENFDNGTVNHGFLDCPNFPAMLGDRVWFDTNRNGIQDEGENGIGGVKVKLFNCSDVLLDSTTTASNGYYLFDQLDAGDYYVQFIIPVNYVVTSQNQGTDDEIDSDADPVTGKTVCTSLGAEETDLSWDAGLYTRFASLGDRVWYDNNENGIQDEGENGVSGVVVRLLDCQGNMLNSTLTNSTGFYLFENLVPGSYKVQFVLPANHVFTLKDAGTDDAVDSDAGIDGFTECTDLVEDEVDLTWDAGIYLEEGEQTDLSLIKLVDNPNPENGDIIKFTIQVTNHGPAQATGVKVIDILPAEVIYQSSLASQGSYDNTSGIWTVGSMNSGAVASLEITVQVDLGSTPSIIDLGPAKGYNVFILQDVNQPSSDTQGKMAVGRDAYLANYSVGDMLPNSNGTVDVLIAGRDLTFISGAVYGGNVVYGANTNLPVPAVSIIHGTLRQDSVINFDSARVYLQTLSSTLAGYTVNGTTTFQWGSLSLTGNDPILNVFSVSGADLSQANYFEINVPSGSVALVNISGTNISWMGGLDVNGTDITNVLYNFTESGQLNLSGIDVQGSILAPSMDVNFQAGVQHGQMIAKSLTGSGQFNLSFFLGYIPEQGIFTNIAEVYFCDQYDPDSTPNNGVETEDDYGKVVVTVGNQGGGGNWQYVGTFISGEMILTLVKDNQGNMYAGTLGGKIFKSTDGGLNWTRINNAMSAVYIWSIAVNSSGDLFAATELGLFKSTNGVDWVITSLSDKDIRTVKIDVSGNMYAGAWGYGIYKSTDSGNTWMLKNNGIISVAAHALVFAADGNIIAATLDFGMYKSTDGGENWSPLDINYPYIWSLGKTSGGSLFAGTYGGGLYKSTDNGTSWSKINNLVAAYIYQITVDSDDNIYVSSWTGGVFASSDDGNTWSGLGMPGSRISAMLLNSTSNGIFAATDDGKLYMTSSVSSTGGTNLNMPKEFELLQNYPNPFNPNTIIRFSIPEAGNYAVKMFNILGQEVKVLVSGDYKPGRYVIEFNGSGLSSGIYFYTLSGGNVNITRKMVLIK